jgi:hypothetical protein
LFSYQFERVDLAAVADVGDALDSGYVGNGCRDRVALEIDHIEESRGQVRGEQLPPFVIGREVIEAAPGRAGKIDRRDLAQCSSGNRRRLGGAVSRERGCHDSYSSDDESNRHDTSARLGSHGGILLRLETLFVACEFTKPRTFEILTFTSGSAHGRCPARAPGELRGETPA